MSATIKDLVHGEAELDDEEDDESFDEETGEERNRERGGIDDSSEEDDDDDDEEEMRKVGTHPNVIEARGMFSDVTYAGSGGFYRRRGR